VEKQGQCLTPFQRKLLLKSLQTDLRPEYRRRIEIMLLADTGQSQAQICKALGVFSGDGTVLDSHGTDRSGSPLERPPDGTPQDS
jgi:hypothetical protein